MATKAFDLKRLLISGLRKLSYRVPARSEAMRAAKVAYGRYLCAQCKGVFPPNEIAVDHVEPVVDPLVGFVDWDTYIVRLFCPADQLQVLCKKPCHLEKSKRENALRKRVKRGT